LVFDHNSNVTYFLGNFETQADFDNWYHAALLRLALVGGQHASYEFRKRNQTFVGAMSQRHSESEYLERIAAAQAAITAGEVYQLCLTNRLEFEAQIDPLALFLALRRENPAPYAAFFRTKSMSVVCSSPEQFLTVNQERVATSRPIKGTRPRVADETSDQAQAAELAAHPKEQAENLMIVDLIRNDLSRVCEPNSIAVPGLFEVESYSTVHQLVSTVQGRLSKENDAIDALASLFPGGSMTGAPKLRAIQLLQELERGARGAYSGVLGYLASNGTADFGMVIRSIVFEANRASIGIGGGITSDSDPAAEYAETQLKAKALLGALGLPAW
jgi:para-aminobenzoate synthetase